MRSIASACLIASCSHAQPPPPVIQARCESAVSAQPCQRARWQKLLDIAIATSAHQGVACGRGCAGEPITAKQASAILDWYCERDAASPRTSLVWLGTDDIEVSASDFWAQATANAYDLRLGSWVAASRDRDVFQLDLGAQPLIACKVTLDTVVVDDRLLRSWVHFYFDVSDRLLAVNVGMASG
jgi:hypothetical protein